MPRRMIVAAAIVLAVVIVVVLSGRRREPALSAQRASWQLTPGVVNPDVTPRTLTTTICKHGWTKTIRPPSSYTSALKREQMRAYRRLGGPSDYQEDHLISLELGGHPTDPRNLWPEPRPRAEEVDQIENELNDEICSGTMTLAQAQRRISEIKHTRG